jgi:hypothetical protein
VESEVGRWILGILSYAYVSVCFYMIAFKCERRDAWFAFFPILDLLLLLSLAGKSYWWILLFFIPVLNLLFIAIVFMGVAEARGKPSWSGLVILIPGVNLLLLGYLAFSS